MRLGNNGKGRRCNSGDDTRRDSHAEITGGKRKSYCEYGYDQSPVLGCLSLDSNFRECARVIPVALCPMHRLLRPKTYCEHPTVVLISYYRSRCPTIETCGLSAKRLCRRPQCLRSVRSLLCVSVTPTRAGFYEESSIEIVSIKHQAQSDTY